MQLGLGAVQGNLTLPNPLPRDTSKDKAVSALSPSLCVLPVPPEPGSS